MGSGGPGTFVLLGRVDGPVRTRPRMSHAETREVDAMRDVGERVIDLIETGVPVGFERYAAAAFGDELPTFGTVAFRGTARIRPGGRGPWLPATAATYHRLGNAFAGEFALAPFRRAILRGTDGYLEGHGASTIAGRPCRSHRNSTGRRACSCGWRPRSSRRRGRCPACSWSRSTTSPCGSSCLRTQRRSPGGSIRNQGSRGASRPSATRKPAAARSVSASTSAGGDRSATSGAGRARG